MRVELKAVSIQFPGRDVLTDFSAVFAPGTVTALVGPSGSGKSTLLATIAGFRSVQSGEIAYYETRGDCGSENSVEIGPVTWISQKPAYFAGRTVIDNVLMGPFSDGLSLDEARGRAMDALQRVGMGQFKDRLAKGLSGGELQRLSFARGIASVKPLMLVDEPSAGLDEVNTGIIASLLGQLSLHSTVIVATHDHRLVEAADDVVSLRS